jgi:hypothetical protein
LSIYGTAVVAYSANVDVVVRVLDGKQSISGRQGGPPGKRRLITVPLREDYDDLDDMYFPVKTFHVSLCKGPSCHPFGRLAEREFLVNISAC